MATDERDTRRWLFEHTDWWLVAAFSAGAVALLAWRTDFYTVGTAAFADPGWDRHAYRELARRDLLDFKLAPYCWRVLVPWLAKFQPWSLQAGFLTLAIVSLAATGPAVYMLTRATGASKISAAPTVPAFYAVGWAARYQLADFWIPDSTSFLLTVVAMWLIVGKRWWAACAVLAVGVLAKESVIFAGSLAFTWHLRGWRDWRTLSRGFLVIAPALLVLVGVRLLIQPENGNESYIATMPSQISRFPELFGEYDYRQRYTDIFVNDRWAHREWDDFDRYLFDPFGLPLLGLAVTGAAVRPGRAARLSPYILLVYSQLLFATDTQRLLVLAFPALGVSAASGTDRLKVRLEKFDAAALSGFAAVFVLTLFEPNVFGAQLWREAAAFVGGGITTLLAQRLRRSAIHNPKSTIPNP